MVGDVKYFRSDPIYALATPEATSALAVFRISGAGSLDLMNGILNRKIPSGGGKGLFYRKLMSGGRVIDEALVSYFPEGHGYTKEESLEISVHGGLAVMKATDALLSEAGFRKALRGEFTFRAMRSGSVSLSEAEAVLELIESDTEEMRSDALRHLEGGLDRVFADIRERLLSIAAVFELQLDYSEDEYDEDTSYPADEIESLIGRVESLVGSYESSRMKRDGVKVALIGRTNEGKSTLFNFLLKSERSIVSDSAGTTRDYICEAIEISGHKVMLYDTAGLNETAEGAESIGIERTESIEKITDVAVYFVTDGNELSEMKRRSETYGTEAIFVRNKLDVRRGLKPIAECIDISSVTGEGVDALVSAIACKVERASHTGFVGECVSSSRQRDVLLKVLACLKGLSERLDVVVLSAEISSALDLVDELLGHEGLTEDTLDAIFSKFCVGK